MTDSAKAKVSAAKKAQSKAAKSQTMADIMAKKKAVTKKVDIQLDGEVADRIAALRQAYTAARDVDRVSNTPDTAPKILTQIEELVEASESTVAIFSFKSIGRPRYDEMVGENPPTPEQKKDGAEFNADTFPPSLVSESSLEPVISLEEAVDIFSSPDWNNAELRKLFFAALEVNTETGDIPLSRDGSETMLASLLNSVSQPNTGSPTLSM